MERYGRWDYDAEGAPANGRTKAPTQFVIKTYQLVDDPATDSIVSWGDERISTFVVWRPTEFARDILPNYFRHNNFSSFVRQLNAYGFRKVVQERWEFGHEFFKKGKKQLLCNVHRGTAAEMAWPPLNFATAVHRFHPAAHDSVGQTSTAHQYWMEPRIGLDGKPSAAPSTVANPAEAVGWGAGRTSNTAELVEENERLQQSNTALQRELTHMRKLYSDIMYFVQNHVGPVPPRPCASVFLQEPGVRSSARKESAGLVSGTAFNHSGRSTTFCSSLTIADKPSTTTPQRKNGDDYDGGQAAQSGTARASTTILFGVRLTAPTTVSSGPKRAATEEAVHPPQSVHASKRRLATETAPN